MKYVSMKSGKLTPINEEPFQACRKPAAVIICIRLYEIPR